MDGGVTGSLTILDLILAAAKQAESELSLDVDRDQLGEFAEQFAAGIRRVFVAGPSHVQNEVENLMVQFDRLRDSACSRPAFELQAVLYLDACYRQFVGVAVERFPARINRRDGSSMLIKRVGLTPRLLLGTSVRAALGHLLRTV